MKKICFVFVLSIVSVFSISAQTNARLTDNPSAAESAKVETESSKTVSEPVQTSDQAPETDAPAEEKKPGVKEEEKKLEVKAAEKKPATAEKSTPRAEAEAVKKPLVAETVDKPQVVVTETISQPVINETAEKKTAAGVTEKKAEAPVLEAKTYSLGALSTGNAAVDGYIEEFSELYDIDPVLIYAQMSQESSFRARATSSKGASGFMQLMPDTARRFGVTNIYNPKQNIKAGIKYMRWLLDKFGGDTRLALAGYNAGEGAVMKYGNKVPPYRETQKYVAKIMNHYELLSNQDASLAQNEQLSNK